MPCNHGCDVKGSKNLMSKQDNVRPPTGSPVLADATIIEYLKACQAILVNHAAERFVEFSRALDTYWADYADRAKTNQEQAEALEQQELLYQFLPEMERYFLGCLGEGFIRFKRQELVKPEPASKPQLEKLSLVDHEDLEESIAITSITHRAEALQGEQLWTLNQRLAVLNHGQKVGDRGNPAGPAQYCDALRRSLQRTTLTTKSKIIAYKLFERELVSRIGEPLAAINQYLRNQGILPNLIYRPVSGDPLRAAASAVPGTSATGGRDTSAPVRGEGSPAVPGGAPVRPDAGLPEEQYQHYLVEAIRTLQSYLGGYGRTPAACGLPGSGLSSEGLVSEDYRPLLQPVPVQTLVAPAGVAFQPGLATTVAGGAGIGQAVTFNSQQLVGALQSLQMQAVTVSGQPLLNATAATLQPLAVAEANQRLAQQLLEEKGEENALDSQDMHTIDLVGMLFEYMLSDDNLPDSVKALLSYLHTPFLKIAFLDKDFFGQTDHPARLLLNSMAEAGVKWVSNDGSSQYDIYDKIKAMVSRVLTEFKNDVRLFAELLLEFSSYTKKIARRQELMERRAMEKVQGEEKLREVKVRVNEEVRSRIDGRELPSAVLLMLLQPWSDFLAFVLLRYGETSDSWRKATQVIDEVLWTIEPKKQNADKERQLGMQAALLSSLEAGFETIGYDQEKGKKLLEALYSLQKMALQSKQVSPAPEPMRSKLEALAARKAGQMPVADAEATPAEREMVEHLKRIEFGTWFEFDGGKRLKVAWYNAKASHYMLVDQMGKKVAMKSGLELARAMLAKKARVIAGSSKPFFDRALENIFQNLNAKAEELQPELSSV